MPSCVTKLDANLPPVQLSAKDIVKFDCIDNSIFIPQISYPKINYATFILKKFFDDQDKVFDIYAA